MALKLLKNHFKYQTSVLFFRWFKAPVEQLGAQLYAISIPSSHAFCHFPARWLPLAQAELASQDLAAECW